MLEPIPSQVGKKQLLELPNECKTSLQVLVATNIGGTQPQMRPSTFGMGIRIV
jgi:hypothetical protein